MKPTADQPTVTLLLEASAFTQHDAEAVQSRLEPEIRVDAGLVAYSPPAGGYPPDVAVQLIASSLPLAEIYVGLLSAAIYDLIKTFATNTGEPETEATLELTMLDDDGNEARTFTGKTTDPEIAERWLRTLNDEARGA
jgi:hypothetical protein